METKQKTFKERLQNLIDEAKMLVTNTTNEEIQQQGIVLIQPTSVISLECKSEEEFGERMLKLVRKDGQVIIPQFPDQVDPEELQAKKQEYMLQGIDLLIPASILPINSMMEDRYFKPYLIVFTYNLKIFMHPVEGDAFYI